MDKTTFGQLAAKLEVAISWLQSNGIEVENTRVQKYHSALKSQLPLDTSTVTKQQHEDFMSTVFEAHTLIEAFEHFPRDYMDVLLSKMDKILDGPLLPDGEAAYSKKGEARNFQYEILLASTLAKYGLEVGFSNGEKEDLHFFFNGEKIYCECKRPLSSKGLPDAIRGGTNQLKTRLTPGLSKEKGLLAISIDKVDQTRKQDIEFGSYEEAEAYLNRQVKSIFTSHGRLIVRKMEKKIPGAICSLYTPLRMKGNTNDLFSVSLNAFVPFDYDNGSNYSYMQTLSEILAGVVE